MRENDQGTIFHHAREKAGLGDDWEWFESAHFPCGNHPLMYTQVIGAIAPVFTKGPRKGHKNWAKRDPSTERTIIITPAEQDAWLARWSERTGLCPECQGKGRRPSGWSKDTGQRYRECVKCNGSGKTSGLKPEDSKTKEKS